MCGITFQTIRRKLLGEADLTLKKAVDIAVGMELTDKEITQISAVQQVHKVQLQECFRCGKHNHSPDKCFHKLSECHICKRKGHISPKCPQKVSTPIVPVLKPNGTIRIWGDFKVTLNQYLDVPEYTMPTSEELFTKLNGGELFTKLDLSHAYQQVVLDEKSQPYVTITTYLGLYRYTRLPFGVAAAPAIFQQIIDKMLDGLSQTGGSLDDLTVTGENDEQLARNLYKTLKKFEESGAKFKKSKCVMMQLKIDEYFAFVPDRHGIHPSPAKVQAILDVRDPQNRSELQSFLGLVNYYRKFIPNMSTLVSPLNQLLSKDTPWCWSPDCKGSFQALKDTLASSAC